jgi:hypothetical protein
MANNGRGGGALWKVTLTEQQQSWLFLVLSIFCHPLPVESASLLTSYFACSPTT